MRNSPATQLYFYNVYAALKILMLDIDSLLIKADATAKFTQEVAKWHFIFYN